jgi:hypothetical protein
MDERGSRGWQLAHRRRRGDLTDDLWHPAALEQIQHCFQVDWGLCRIRGLFPEYVQCEARMRIELIKQELISAGPGQQLLCFGALDVRGQVTQ